MRDTAQHPPGGRPRRFKLPGAFLIGSHSRDRLERALITFRGEFEFRIENVLLQDKPTRERPNAEQRARLWADASLEMLQKAERACSEGRIEEGWQTFNEARRLQAFGLDRRGRLLMAQALRQEADEKLFGWRKEAVRDALPEQLLQGKQDIDPERIYAARRVLDEALQDSYLKLALLRSQFYFLSCFLVVIGVALGICVTRGWLGEGKLIGDWKTFNTVVLLGGFGGALSAILSSARTSLRSKVPSIIGDGPGVLLRPVLGASSAVGLVIVLQAGALASADSAKILPIAIAAGFSEQLLARALESVSAAAKNGKEPS